MWLNSEYRMLNRSDVCNFWLNSLKGPWLGHVSSFSSSYLGKAVLEAHWGWKCCPTSPDDFVEQRTLTLDKCLFLKQCIFLVSLLYHLGLYPHTDSKIIIKSSNNFFFYHLLSRQLPCWILWMRYLIWFSYRSYKVESLYSVYRGGN